MQSLCNTAGATTGEDAHLVTDGKFFMGRQPLHNRDGAAVIQLDGDLHTLTTGNTFFNGRAGHTTCDSTNHRHDGTAPATTQRTAANTTHHRAGASTHGRFRTLNFHRPESDNFTILHLLGLARLGATIGVARTGWMRNRRGRSQQTAATQQDTCSFD
jgi:hypothetical protein